MFGAEYDEENTSGLIGIIIFGSAFYTVVFQVFIMIVCCVVCHAGVLIRFMVTYGGHDGQIGGHELRLEEVDMFILFQCTQIYLVADIHDHIDIFFDFSIFFFDFSLGGFHEPFISAPAFYLVVAHE